MNNSYTWVYIFLVLLQEERSIRLTPTRQDTELGGWEEQGEGEPLQPHPTPVKPEPSSYPWPDCSGCPPPQSPQLTVSLLSTAPSPLTHTHHDRKRKQDDRSAFAPLSPGLPSPLGHHHSGQPPEKKLPDHRGDLKLCGLADFTSHYPGLGGHLGGDGQLGGYGAGLGQGCPLTGKQPYREFTGLHTHGAGPQEARDRHKRHGIPSGR